MIIKNKGFTLLEALLALSVSSIAATSFINFKINETKNLKTSQLANDAIELLNGFDQRLSVDGYSIEKWNELQYNNNQIKKLVQENLQAINSKCKTGKWQPVDISKNNLKLVSCDLFNKRNFDIKMDVKINSIANYINNINVDYYFKNEKDFEENFLELRQTFFKLKSQINNSSLNNFYYSMIDKNNGNELSVKQCMNIKNNCALRTSIDRKGGAEYVRADGTNSMINSQLTFVETADDAPLKCVKWSKINGIWTHEIDQNCGIGIYKQTGSPIAVDIAANNGTFKTLFLDKKCSIFEFNGVEVIDTNRKSPCGFDVKNNIAYQIIDNINAKNGIISNLYSNEIKAKNAKIEIGDFKDIVAKTINADVITVKNKLKVENLSEFNSFNANYGMINTLTVNGNSNLNNLGVNTINSNNNILSKTKMKAPVGDFDNINLKLNELENKINNLDNKVDLLPVKPEKYGKFHVVKEFQTLRYRDVLLSSYKKNVSYEHYNNIKCKIGEKAHGQRTIGSVSGSGIFLIKYLECR